jgi:hypothetical protein
LIGGRWTKTTPNRVEIGDAIGFLRHTFGTRMAAQGVPMRALQEMMGHRDFKTTLIYADYQPSGMESQWAEAAFGATVTNPVTNLSAPEVT